MGLLDSILNKIRPAEDHPGRDTGEDSKFDGFIGWLLDKTELDEMIAEKASSLVEGLVDDLVGDTLEPMVKNIVAIAKRQLKTIGGEFRDVVSGDWEAILNTVIEPLLIALVNSLRLRAEEEYPQLKKTNIDEGISLVIAERILGLSDLVRDALDDEDEEDEEK